MPIGWYRRPRPRAAACRRSDRVQPRAATMAVSDSVHTVEMHPEARTEPGSAPSATSHRHRRRPPATAAWHGDPIPPAAPPRHRPRSPLRVPAAPGSGRTRRPGPSTSRSQPMIGVPTTGPVPSSTTPASPPATRDDRCQTATVCSTNTSRAGTSARHPCPDTTCIDRMLSPPRSKNESSTPTRSSRAPRRRCRPGSPRPRGGRGAVPIVVRYSGAGNALVSSLP